VNESVLTSRAREAFPRSAEPATDHPRWLFRCSGGAPPHTMANSIARRFPPVRPLMRLLPRGSSLVPLAALVLCVPVLPAADPPEWGQFLGPNRDGVSTEKGLNLDWEKKPPKELWKVPLGSGY